MYVSFQGLLTSILYKQVRIMLPTEDGAHPMPVRYTPMLGSSKPQGGCEKELWTPLTSPLSPLGSQTLLGAHPVPFSPPSLTYQAC